MSRQVPISAEFKELSHDLKYSIKRIMSLQNQSLATLDEFFQALLIVSFSGRLKLAKFAQSVAVPAFSADTGNTALKESVNEVDSQKPSNEAEDPSFPRLLVRELSPTQLRVYQFALQQSGYFTPQSLSEKLALAEPTVGIDEENVINSIHVQRSLQLFAACGLIVPVLLFVGADLPSPYLLHYRVLRKEESSTQSLLPDDNSVPRTL